MIKVRQVLSGIVTYVVQRVEACEAAPHGLQSLPE